MRHQRHRQERWLHTRISEDLEEALKSEARRRRTPVSLLVRNVLEGALNLVEDIVEDSLHIARESRRFAAKSSRTARHATAPLQDVYGWQELILNLPAACTQCDSALAAGVKAYRGLRETSGPTVFLCSDCLRQLRQSTGRQKEEA